jgi:hypothetical protein
LKRFAAIVTIVVVVLAMSVGTAFASVCAGGSCSSTAMLCPDAGTMACPMNNGAPMAHSDCGQPMDHSAQSAVSGQPVPQIVVASAPLAVVPGDVTLGGVASSLPATDARGAPHLSTVIRI